MKLRIVPHSRLQLQAILAGSNSGIDMRMILSLQTLKKYGA